MIDELTGHQKVIVSLTDRASIFASQAIKERGFDADSALCVTVTDDFHPRFRIQFDYPDSDGSQWRGESNGRIILVDKASAAAVNELVIDCENDEFIFLRNGMPVLGP